MLPESHAIQAYKDVSRYGSQRDHEADVFRQALSALNEARNASSIQQILALSDNRRLWMAINDRLRNPNNGLPEPLKASILSVGLAFQKEMDQEFPNFEFLIFVNENIAAGLSGEP